MIKSIKDFNVEHKRILVRCDFNVPLNERGEIVDDFKIRQTLPTIQYLVGNQAKVILISHLDPKNTGVVDAQYTLQPIRDKLSQLIGVEVTKTNDCVGEEVAAKVNKLGDGGVLLLENVRFHEEEVQNSEEFAKDLAGLGDIFINDAFAECHRAYASIVGIPRYLPHGAGLLLNKEINNLTKIIKDLERPFGVVMGGAKVTTKVKFIEKMSEVADFIIISGLIQKELEKEGINLPNAEKVIMPVSDLQALDISEESIQLFAEKIATAKTIVWNGPFGKIEEKEFRNGTLQIAEAIIESGAFSIVGGGETIEFLDQENLTDKFSHVSTGGGAMLDFLSGEKLPGIEALEN